MKPIVYLIGVNQSSIRSINDLLSGLFEVKHITRAGLMTSIYKEKPSCILIIESDLDRNSLTAIDSTLSLEYIPTICISFNKTAQDVAKNINRASYIDGDQLEVVLLPLLEQAVLFAQQYDGLNVCYDTYEIMNEEVRDALDTYIDSRLEYSEFGIIDYFSMVYNNNMFLKKIPTGIWLLKAIADNVYHATLYGLEAGEILKEFDYYDESFSFSTYSDTGFFKNEGSHELSDIDSLSELMPLSVLKECVDINNVACFAMQEVMLIGVNYNESIQQRDLNILKALTIKVDLMVNIKTQMSKLEASFIYTMNALARAAEGKDDVTGHHIKRVNLYSKLIAEKLDMAPDFIEQIAVAAQMHDVGKILISDEILNKPGKLTDDEYKTMQLHTVFGQKVIGESDHLTTAATIARYHHEKYDGAGYPDGIKGEAIPIAARIVALADIYDALRSARPYKKGFTHEESYDIIVHGDGRVEPHHFDPDVLAIFEEGHEAFRTIFDSLEDEG